VTLCCHGSPPTCHPHSSSISPGISDGASGVISCPPNCVTSLQEPGLASRRLIWAPRLTQSCTGSKTSWTSTLVSLPLLPSFGRLVPRVPSSLSHSPAHFLLISTCYSPKALGGRGPINSPGLLSPSVLWLTEVSSGVLQGRDNPLLSSQQKLSALPARGMCVLQCRGPFLHRPQKHGDTFVTSSLWVGAASRGCSKGMLVTCIL
jgi:hypothetical protein